MTPFTAQPKTIRRAIEATQEHMRRVQWDMRNPEERAEETVLATKRIHMLRRLLRDREAELV